MFQQTPGTTLQTLSGSGTVDLGSQTLTISNGGGTTDGVSSGVIQDGGIAGGSGGSLVISGGTEYLTGANSYTGTTSISSDAKLVIGNNTATGALGSGAVTDNGTLAFALTGNTTLGAFSGSGGLEQDGSGTLTLTGDNSYTGATTVNAGTLTVDGSISSAVTVANGGRLGGTGTVGTTTIQHGGTLAPGDGIGTLDVNGNLTMAAGSTLSEDVSSSAADETIVSGSASLSGILSENFSGGSYTAGTTYTILHSTGTLSGAFSGFSTAGLPPGLSGLVTYDAHNVYLTVQNGPPPPPQAAQSEVAFISGVAANGTLPLDAFYAWNQGTIPANYAGGYTNSMKWGADTAGTPGGTIAYYFNPASNWTASEEQVLSAGLALWSDIANISFVQTMKSGRGPDHLHTQHQQQRRDPSNGRGQQPERHRRRNRQLLSPDFGGCHRFPRHECAGLRADRRIILHLWRLCLRNYPA